MLTQGPSSYGLVVITILTISIAPTTFKIRAKSK